MTNLVLPGIGSLLTAWLWTSLPHVTLLVGPTWFAVGFIGLVLVTRGFRRPPRFCK